jgi:hypothetical protein
MPLVRNDCRLQRSAVAGASHRVSVQPRKVAVGATRPSSGIRSSSASMTSELGVATAVFSYTRDCEPCTRRLANPKSHQPPARADGHVMARAGNRGTRKPAAVPAQEHTRKPRAGKECTHQRSRPLLPDRPQGSGRPGAKTPLSAAVDGRAITGPAARAPNEARLISFQPQQRDPRAPVPRRLSAASRSRCAGTRSGRGRLPAGRALR